MPAIEITCPSGLKGIVRGLKGKEIDLFANKTEIRKRRVGTKILQACWNETLEPGPAYPWLEGAAVNWDKILTADRFYVLLQIRAATYGSDYAFNVQCDNGSCERRFEWQLDLNDLPFREIPLEAIEQFKNGNRFTVDVEGAEVVHRLSTGADEKRMLEARDLAPDRIATTALLHRVISVGGETDYPVLRKWVEELEVGTVFDLIDTFDENDGGVETDIEVQCNRCGNYMDMTLPLEDDFWSPKKSRRSKRGKANMRSSLAS